MLPEIATVVTVRAGDTPPLFPDALQERCQTCEEAVWLSPATAEMVRTYPGTITVMCLECAKAKGLLDLRPMPLTDAQRAELATKLGIDPVDLDEQELQELLRNLRENDSFGGPYV
jgi:hypothetical protein